jgi:hypothetical protein
MAEVMAEYVDQVPVEAMDSTLGDAAAKWAGRMATVGLVLLAKHYVQSGFSHAKNNNFYRRGTDREF